MLLSIFVLVPGGLPWAHGTRLTVPDESGEVRLAFHRTRPPTAGADEAFAIAAEAVHRDDREALTRARPHRPLDLSHSTVVEITTHLSEQNANQIHQAVHRSIDALHIADRAAVIATGSTRQPVGPAGVWPVIPAVVAEGDEKASPRRPRVIVLGEGKPPPPPSPTVDRGVLPAVAAAVEAISVADPISRWREWRAAATASRRDARISTAIAQLCCAVEVLVDGALGLELYEADTALPVAGALLHRPCSEQLHQGLGIDPRHWHAVAALRSALLQRGENPLPERVEAAFGAADALYGELARRGHARRAERSRTAELLRGEFWTQRRGAAPEARAWLARYPSWRAAVQEVAS